MRERAWRWAPWIGAVALVGAALALAGARSLRGDLACAPGLGPQQTRCCAPGQTEAHGRCVGAARSCPAPLELVAQSCVAPPVVVDVPEIDRRRPAAGQVLDLAIDAGPVAGVVLTLRLMPTETPPARRETTGYT